VTQERWQQVKAVLQDALEKNGTERAAFLETACQGDEELRSEVESLLACEGEVDDFIETPFFRIWRDDDKPLAEGERIGAYRIVREAGRGGMGSVYLAERADEEFHKQAAIKVVRRGMDSDEIVRRFRSERQILAHLDHPHIAKLLDGGTTADGRPYFVMEWVEGRPIDEYCDAHQLSTRARLELFRKVCSAVHFAHQNLVVHRDLKPGNILVTADGEPKLLDFGIAKLLDPDQELFALTRADLRPMTPEYASPEQARGEAITTASDVYSLGVLLYVLLTGHSPYESATRDPASLAKAICETNPPRPSSVIGRVKEIRRPDGSVLDITPESVSQVRDGEPSVLRRRLAGDLDNIVLMAMRKDPQRRYASVDQLSNDIGRHLQDLPVIARKDTVGYRTAKFIGRHKWGFSLATLSLLLIIGFSVATTVLWQRAVRERERSDAVSTFLQDLFENPDPKRSHGEKITAREVLDGGVQKINTNLRDQPELRADLLGTMGLVYRRLGLYETAKELLQGSLRLRQQSFGRNDPRTANSLHNLASVLRDLGDNATAEPLVREALSIQEEIGETQNIEYAKGLTNLGAILEEKGQLDKAEALYKESLAIKRSLPDIDEGDLARSYNNMGKLYYTRGDYDAAEPYYQEALAIRRKLAKGLPDPDVASTLGNLASLREEKEDLAGAEVLHREVLNTRRKLYPDGLHPLIARTLNNLGHVLQAEGKSAEAEECYREAIDIADVKLGPDHQERANYVKNLATTLLALGRPAEAEAKAREALAVFRKAEDPAPLKIAETESILGGCLAAQRRFEEAEPLLVESYQILAQNSGDGAKRAPEALKRIVDFYIAWGKPERAAQFQAQVASVKSTH
jgi:serine/threonine protein kinase/Tfp pilus assembly protein PilF